MTAVECAAQLRQKAVCTIDEVLPLFDGQVSKSTVYDAVRSGDFCGVEPIRVGRRLLIPVQPLLAALGLHEEEVVRPTTIALD